MNFNIKKISLFAWALAVLASCKKDEGHQPVSTDGTVPQPISQVQVENRPGKAKITYQVPTDKNLLYVQAEYMLSSGKMAEVKSSYYLDSLIVDGFADTLEHEIKLYSVSRSGVKSTPLSVKIKPLEAPLWKVFKSIIVNDAFGGFNVQANNPTGDNVGLLILTENAFKEYEVNNEMSVFTNERNIMKKVRGLDTVVKRYGFVAKDRWGNTTDTVYKEVKPIYEVQLEPAKFRAVVLPGDAPQVTNGARLEYAWDNRLGWPYTSFTHQLNGGTQPHMVTFDMGVNAKLSRIWIRPYPEGNRWYFLTTMKKFEIWGSNNPSSNGALDNSWTLLNTYEVVKPSGLPYGTDNALDQATASAGFDWEIPLTAPRVQFIRVRCLENFAGGTAQSINELKVYGDPR